MEFIQYKVLGFNDVDNGYELNYENRYSYDDKGRMIADSLFFEMWGSGYYSYYSSINYTYFNDKIASVYYSNDKHKEVFHYNQSGYLTEKHFINSSGYLYKRTIYGYSLKENWPVLGFNENNEELAFTTYPNPVNDQLNITLKSPQHANIVIYDVLGNEKLKQEVNVEDFTINTSTLSQGMYIIKVFQNDKMNSRTFIKN